MEDILAKDVGSQRKLSGYASVEPQGVRQLVRQVAPGTGENIAGERAGSVPLIADVYVRRDFLAAPGYGQPRSETGRTRPQEVIRIARGQAHIETHRQPRESSFPSGPLHAHQYVPEARVRA